MLDADLIRKEGFLVLHRIILTDPLITAKVVTGTSAGALVAAFLCTHTDDELRRMLIPELAEKITACEEPFKVRCGISDITRTITERNLSLDLGKEAVQDRSPF